ncbi:MAG: NADPH:quinone reductase [Oscillospiraceae bacterium]|nr:NADPH:quinone reductase [Oscillospiraceae bacterium]
MKVIRVSQFGDPDVLRLVDAPVPEPGAGEVRVRLYAVGVNPVETYIRSGNYAAGLPALPYTPGTDGAGIVDAVGSAVPGGGGSALKVGDRVYVAGAVAKRITGTYAEYVACDAGAVFRLPAHVPFEQGAGLGTPGLTACQALFRRARLAPGETALIHGASGGVGSLAVQLAKARGAVVYGTAGSAEGLSMLKELGADRAFDHSQGGYEAEILSATGGRGVDAIIEMLANINLEKDLEMVATRGRIAIVGNRGNLDFNPRLVMLKDADVLGVMLKNMLPGELSANVSALNDAVGNGVRVRIAAEYPLDDAAGAHASIMSGSGKTGKIILRIA